MKGKLCKIGLIFTMSFSLLGMNMNKSSAVNLETTGLDTDYEMLELQRPKQGDNLVVNGGFENGGNGWNKTGDGGFTNYPGCAAAGEYCGLLPSNSSNASVYQLLTLEPNTDYKITAKVQFGEVGSQAFLAIKTPTVENLNPAIETTITCNEGEAWVYKDISFEFNSGNNTNVALTFLKWTEDTSSAIYKSQVYIDEVTLSALGADESIDEDYEVVWKDEFDGKTGDVDANGLDSSNWGYELGCIRGVEQQHYTKDRENVRIEDGKLVLEVTNRDKDAQYVNPRKTPNGGTRQVIYNSGSVRTHGKKDFLYGRIEILAKLPEGRATFPAFWTLGSDFTLDGSINGAQGDGWPVSGEIDIMESIGDPNVVFETLHYAQTSGDDNGKYAGNGKTTSITTQGTQIGEDTYHVFGINWSKNKIEWYIDDQIVRTVDYSDDPIAQNALNRPQYIQLNFATGGNWPGDAGTNLAGQSFDIEYVYYAQNQAQKEAAAEYYNNTVRVNANNVTAYAGTVPDLLNNVTLTPGSDHVDISEFTVDYSIENEHMFTTNPDLTDGSTSNDTNQTKVECLVDSVKNSAKIAELTPGEYNIHYSAMHDDLPSVRKTVKLIILEEPIFPSDFKLNGIVGDKLETIALPEGWSWVEPDSIITGTSDEYDVKYVNGEYSKTVKVVVNATVVDKKGLEDKLNEALEAAAKTDVYKAATLEKLNEAITAANDVLNNISATDEMVADAIRALNTALANLEKYVTEKEVEEAVAQGNELVLKTDIYTKESLDVLNEALLKVRNAIKSGDKEEIEAAYGQLNEAIAKLVKIDTPVSEVKPENKTEATTSVKPTVSVKTGDNTYLGMIMTSLLLSAGGLSLFRRRKHF